MLILGALLAAAGVGLGAFGAHGLSDVLGSELAPAERERRLDNWDVAVRYQMYHALGLLAAGILSRFNPSRALRWAAWLFLLGVAIFSGCLYVLVLSGIKILGAIVPIGGVAMIAGWIALAAGSAGRQE